MGFIIVMIGVFIVIIIIAGARGSSSMPTQEPSYSRDWGTLDSAKSPEELYKRLRQRPAWNRCHESHLKQIFRNANGDMGKLMRFIMISDTFDLVNRNYLKLDAQLQTIAASPEMTLGFYATALERVGAQQSVVFSTSQSDKEKRQSCT